MVKVDSKKIEFHLNEKWKVKICPMCGTNNLKIQKNIIELNEFNNKLLPNGTQYARFSVIPVICINCGNVLLVSAEISGIMPEEVETIAEVYKIPIKELY